MPPAIICEYIQIYSAQILLQYNNIYLSSDQRIFTYLNAFNLLHVNLIPFYRRFWDIKTSLLFSWRCSSFSLVFYDAFLSKNHFSFILAIFSFLFSRIVLRWTIIFIIIISYECIYAFIQIKQLSTVRNDKGISEGTNWMSIPLMRK